MTSTGFSSPWEGVWSLDAIVNRRIRRPRTVGITMVIDSGLGSFRPERHAGAYGRLTSIIGSLALAPQR